VVSVPTPPAHGSVVLNQDGSFTYTKGAGFVDSDSFVYRVNRDGGFASATVTVGDLKMINVTFDNLPAYGGEKQTGRVHFNLVPFRGDFTVSESSSIAIASTGFPFVFPTSADLSFTVTSSPVSQPTNVAVTAHMHGLSKTGVLTLYPGTVADLTLSKNPAVGGETITGTITLNGPAIQARNIQVSPGQGYTAPSAVAVAAGATQASFAIKTNFVSTDTSTSVSIQAGSNAITKLLSIKAHPRVTSFGGPSTLTSGEGVLHGELGQSDALFLQGQLDLDEWHHGSAFRNRKRGSEREDLLAHGGPRGDDHRRHDDGYDRWHDRHQNGHRQSLIDIGCP
jgi:hypothetical protein